MKLPSLTPAGDRRARRLFRRLFLSYVVAAVAVVGTSAVALYLFVSHSLRQHLQEELIVLAEAAAPSLEVAQDRSEFFDPATAAEHWHALEQHSQSLEWYDPQGNPIVREGKVFSNLPLPDVASIDIEGQVELDRQQRLYVATLPVFDAGQPIGIVRASEALRIVEAPLTRLKWGLIIGGGLGLGALSLFGAWLSRLALEPYLQSYQRLRQFTADASHEMRSPLAVAQAALDVISSHAELLPEADRGNLALIDSATHQLRTLTEALLKFARTDKAAELSLESIPLHELLQDTVDALELIAEDKGIQLSCGTIEPAIVRGDSSKLVELFDNLLHNGIKYTPSGGSIAVELTRKGSLAIASITDTGVGIAPEDIPHVFERFWRADKARTSQTKGLGLGLAIAANIAQLHGGEIQVRSQLRQGSTFTVCLPLSSKD
ncbi:MAG: HAMP domain-containing sensor histidine kinase [Cyanobacteria bacterium P01_E01_bin.34]